MSAWELPTTVMVAGSSFAIRSDFRAVLDALAALTDPDLTQQEQYVACLQILYPRWKELPDANAALRAAFTFINEGKEDEQQGFRPRLVDWEQDAALIAPAVDKVLGYGKAAIEGKTSSISVAVHWLAFNMPGVSMPLTTFCRARA